MTNETTMVVMITALCLNFKTTTRQHNSNINNNNDNRMKTGRNVSNGSTENRGASSNNPVPMEIGMAQENPQCFSCEAWGHKAINCPNRRQAMMAPSQDVRMTDA